MRKLMEIVIKYEDTDGRVLSEPFMKLPSRKELPDYYEVIKRPVDIKKMLGKIEDNKYDSLDALEKDFLLLVDNTQKYNEDCSLISEDSIVLKEVFLSARKRLEEYEEDEGNVDDVSIDQDDTMDGESSRPGSSSNSGSRKKKRGEGKGRKRKSMKYVSDDDDDVDDDGDEFIG